MVYYKYMSSRPVPFVNGELYHIFNRGVAKMPIFNNSYDHNRFIKTVLYYSVDDLKPKFSIFTPTTRRLNTERKIVNFVCYCFMPNHFHFLLQQVKEGGITEFMSKISNSYTKYFNTKNKRVGPLLQGEFKAVHIEKDEQLLHVSRYIHLNPLVGYLTKDLKAYRWSSYLEYLNLTDNTICSKELVLDQFNSPNAYKQFLLDQKDYALQLEVIKHQLIDSE